MINEFKPTWLYIKQHKVSGLKYFGKTTRDPIKYNGSGVYWKRHLITHGSEITTLWSQLFNNKESLIEYALNFSQENNIVDSSEWANLIIENGLDGGNFPGIGKGRIMSEETKQKLRLANLGKKQSRESGIAKSIALTSKSLTEQHKAKLRKEKPLRTELHSNAISTARKGKPWSDARRSSQERRDVDKSNSNNLKENIL